MAWRQASVNDPLSVHGGLERGEESGIVWALSWVHHYQHRWQWVSKRAYTKLRFRFLCIFIASVLVLGPIITNLQGNGFQRLLLPWDIQFKKNNSSGISRRWKANNDSLSFINSIRELKNVQVFFSKLQKFQNCSTTCMLYGLCPSTLSCWQQHTMVK